MKPFNQIPSYRSIRHFPGRPLAQRFAPKEEDCESKLDKFQALLESYSLSIGDLCQLSWSGVPVKVRVTGRTIKSNLFVFLFFFSPVQVRAVTWRLLSGYLPINLDRRQDALESKRANYWSLVKQYYDTDRDETYQDTYRQVRF